MCDEADLRKMPGGRAVGAVEHFEYYRTRGNYAGDGNSRLCAAIVEAYGNKAIAEAAQKAPLLKRRAMQRRQRRGVMLRLFLKRMNGAKES